MPGLEALFVTMIFFAPTALWIGWQVLEGPAPAPEAA